MKITHKKEWDFITAEICGTEKPSVAIDGMHLFKRDFLMFLQTLLEQDNKFEFYQKLKELYVKMPKFKDGKQITEWMY